MHCYRCSLRCLSASFPISRGIFLIRQAVADAVQVARPYRVEQRAFETNPIDSRFALFLDDFGKSATVCCHRLLSVLGCCWLLLVVVDVVVVAIVAVQQLSILCLSLLFHGAG